MLILVSTSKTQVCTQIPAHIHTYSHTLTLTITVTHTCKRTHKHTHTNFNAYTHASGGRRSSLAPWRAPGDEWEPKNEEEAAQVADQDPRYA
jgi:hypothetical protein